MMRAILFDMFGTLVVGSASRTEPRYYDTHGLLRAQGIDIPYDRFIQTWSTVMDGLDRWSAQTQQEYPMGLVAHEFLAALGAAATADFGRELTLSYLQERFAGLRAIPGVSGLLAELSRHFLLGMVTNTHHAPLVYEQLERNSLREHFKVIVTSDEHGWRKPHLSIFDVALSRLGIHAGQAVFVGDSYDADYLGAVRAGMQAVLVDPTASHPIPELHRVRSILELREHPILTARSRHND